MNQEQFLLLQLFIASFYMSTLLMCQFSECLQPCGLSTPQKRKDHFDVLHFSELPSLMLLAWDTHVWVLSRNQDKSSKHLKLWSPSLVDNVVYKVYFSSYIKYEGQVFCIFGHCDWSIKLLPSYSSWNNKCIIKERLKVWQWSVGSHPQVESWAPSKLLGVFFPL